MKIAIIGSAESFTRETLDLLIDRLADDEPLVIMLNSPGGPIPGYGTSFPDINHRLIEAELLLAASAHGVRDEIGRLASSVDLVKPFKADMLDFGRQLNLLAAPMHKPFPAKKRSHKRTGHHAARDRIISKDAYTRSRK